MNEFPEPLLDDIRRLFTNRQYLHKTARYISIRSRGKGGARIYTVYLDGTVVCDGEQVHAYFHAGRPVFRRRLCSYQFPTLPDALKFVQTGLVLKLYREGVPEYFTRRN